MKTKQFKLNLCLLLFALGFMLTTGMKCKKDNLDKDGLPKATQTGANTLGFLLNGEPWYPKGMVGLSSNLSLYYSSGVFNLKAYRKLNTGTTEQIALFGETIQDAQKINFPSEKIGLSFNKSCTYSTNDENAIVSGYLDIKVLDKINGIFAGEFAFTLIKEGCDTVKITNGRFDMKF